MKALFTLIIGIFLILSYQNGFAEFNPPHTRIVYHDGDYYDNITEAVNAAQDSDAILIYPGIYNDTNVVIDAKVHFVGVGNVLWKGRDTLFILNEDEVVFEGITFEATEGGGLASISNYQYIVKSCTLRCRTFDFGQDTSHWENCHFYPKSTTGWEIKNINTGDQAVVQMHSCKLGDDIPNQPELACGLNILNDATLSAYFCEFYSDSSAITCDDGRLRMNYCMFIGEQGNAIKASGASSLLLYYCIIENDDSTYDQPTIKVADNSTVEMNNCNTRNHNTPTELQSLLTSTQGIVKLIDNNFKGELELNPPGAGTAGDVFFYGSNTTITSGVTVAEGVTTTGRALKHRVYGEAQFDGESSSVDVFVKNMPETAAVTFSYKHDVCPNIGDATSAVEVNRNQTFTIHRGTSNVTADIWFYWTAEWEE